MGARTIPAACLVLFAAGCGEDSPTEPGGEPQGPPTLTVDASQGWVYVSLDETSSVVSVADAAASTEWDLAFSTTQVMVNGGAAGPGGVEGYCVCQNAGATDEALQAMTPETELADFTAVDEASIPAEADAWQVDALAPAIDGWYSYDQQTHTVSAAADRVFLVRTAEGTAFAKLHVTGIEGAGREHSGQVTIEYAVQAAAGEPMGEVTTATLDATAGPVYFDLIRGEVTDASDWDLMLEGYTILLNGGVSGDGEAAALVAEQAFGEVTDAGGAPASAYQADGFGGVFDQHAWYRYDLAGNHQIWPTYDVYLLRRGTEVYKVQLTGYYSAAGDARHITFRYAPLGADGE